MSAALPIPLIQLLQVLTIALAAPGVTGVIAKVEARLQGRRGPRIAQPYYDLAKLFRKEALAPEGVSWFFLAAPVIAVMEETPEQTEQRRAAWPCSRLAGLLSPELRHIGPG